MDLPKKVNYWIGTPTDAAIAAGDRDVALGWAPNDEVDEVRWVRAHRIEGLLTYAQDVQVVGDALARRRSTSPLIVLRHARAEKRAVFRERFDGFPPHDHERPLTDEGDAYTHMIAKAMAAYGIKEVFSSPAKRCVDTVSPLVVAPHQVRREPAFSEYGFEADRERTEVRAREIMNIAAPLVISSHRPVIPTILRAIADGSHSLLPPAKLKPGQFVVFHRPVKSSGALSNQRAFTVEHSADALAD
jgi:8-oxo-dGTP diphosphatase